jgi:hypothetical protein
METLARASCVLADLTTILPSLVSLPTDRSLDLLAYLSSGVVQHWVIFAPDGFVGYRSEADQSSALARLNGARFHRVAFASSSSISHNSAFSCALEAAANPGPNPGLANDARTRASSARFLSSVRSFSVGAGGFLGSSKSLWRLALARFHATHFVLTQFRLDPLEYRSQEPNSCSTWFN